MLADRPGLGSALKSIQLLSSYSLSLCKHLVNGHFVFVFHLSPFIDKTRMT